MRTAFEWLRHNGLTLTFLTLFVICFALQTVTGRSSYNETLHMYGRPPVGFAHYLRTGDFLAGAFSNWQSALLQLACLVVLGGSLRQKGASHSRKPESRGDHDGHRASWPYRNSLSLALWSLFAATFVGHLLAGAAAYNSRLGLAGRPPIAPLAYFATDSFWFKTMQTWQAEFVVMAAFLVLSIYLRQQGSAESKPVESGDDQTGGANE